MAEVDLSRLRVLRRRVVALNQRVAQDLEAYFDPTTGTYRQMPEEKISKDSIRVSTTCTALMTLASNGRLTLFQAPSIGRTMRRIASASWCSGGLPDGNPFTTVIVLRAAGSLAKSGTLSARQLRTLQKGKAPGRKSLNDRALDIANDLPASLAIQRYPPAPALGYWFLCGVEDLGITLPQEAWLKITGWATREFARQVSMVSAQHDAMMDPIALGMAACITAKLRRIASSSVGAIDEVLSAGLPSTPELQNALDMIFGCQQASGIWPKYFPLFHYDSGSNYCFSFELLEALLHELDEGLIMRSTTVAGLERAVDWCVKNRYEYHFDKQVYGGWNSGGQLTSLGAGKPESWATGVVHMFLFRLARLLSASTQRRLREKYDATSPKEQPGPTWNSLVASGVTFPRQPPTTVQEVIQDEMLNKARELRELDGEIGPITHRRSALLFGPPGTSKTSLVRAFAREIGWPYIEITPSHFLRKGLEQIYVQADEVFDDLMDLKKVVILFDEMDALVQRRTEGGNAAAPIDVTRQFLTTSMLPKLAKLHDGKSVIFFMATNHQAGFDPAIKRPGRFDLLLFMGPPEWEYKLRKIEAFLPKSLEPRSAVIANWLREWTRNSNAWKSLDLFTFGEMQAFLEHFCRAQGREAAELAEILEENNSAEAFRKEVVEWRKKLIALWGDQKSNPLYEQYLDDKKESRRQ